MKETVPFGTKIVPGGMGRYFMNTRRVNVPGGHTSQWEYSLFVFLHCESDPIPTDNPPVQKLEIGLGYPTNQMDFSHTKRVNFVKDENYTRLILAIQSKEIRKMKGHMYAEVNGNMTGNLTDMKQIADVFGIEYHTLYNNCKGRI